MEEISEVMEVPASDQSNVFGQFDSHIKKLERQRKPHRSKEGQGSHP